MPVCMDDVGVIRYNNNEQPSPRRIIDCLLMKSTDDTQTALANEDIHLSETKTIQWRMLAKRNPIIIIKNESEEQQSSCMPHMFSAFTRVLRGRQPAYPSAREAARR